ncbi:hypothetical protein TNCV_5009631 [Trichonephila clavipes]|nr:hypothetical protein TNCV_5009631 [Trichonephila clavipes]
MHNVTRRAVLNGTVPFYNYETRCPRKELWDAKLSRFRTRAVCKRKTASSVDAKIGESSRGAIARAMLTICFVEIPLGLTLDTKINLWQRITK